MMATDYLQPPSMLLGIGGANPGVVAYDPESRQGRRILSSPAGQSVYAVAMSADGQVVAAGTKTGALYWIMRREPEAIHPIHQAGPSTGCAAAPVLALTFMDRQTIAVSDTVGRCLLWQLGANESPGALVTGKRVIAALCRPNAEHLAGVSVSGELLEWDCRGGDIAKIVQIPVLPDVCALVEPIYWPAADSWVWPGRDGMIALYRWRQHEVSTVRAHEGDLYAVVVCRNELLTIGRTDGCLKRWRGGSDGPVDSLDAPKGVISAASWPRDQAEDVVLLVDDTGKAGVYSWCDGRLDLIEWLTGEDYRRAVSPDVEAYKAARCHHEALQVKQLAAHMERCIAQRQLGELEPSYHRLADLGYGHVAYALRAQEARSNNDLVGELRAYTELARVMVPDRPGCERSLSRYSQLLERVWQLPRAREIYQRLVELTGDNCNHRETLQRLSSSVSLVETGDCVIETDLPLETLVRSATVLGAQFTGRYVVRNIGVPISCNVIIAADEFVKRYERISRARPQVPLPPAEQVQLWWLSREKAYQVTTVLFRDDAPDSSGCVELGIKLFNVRLQTVLAPVVIFHAHERAKTTPIEQHNAAVLEQLRRMESSSPAKGWLQAVYRTARQAIRQVITRAFAESM